LRRLDTARTVVTVPIRVLIAGLPPLVADVVASTCDRPPDFEVVGVVPESLSVDETTLELAITANSPTAVVVGVDTDAERRALADLQVHHCEVVHVGLTRDGARAWRTTLRADLVALDSVSPESIRNVIQRASGARA
jgi:hypothetical protein